MLLPSKIPPEVQKSVEYRLRVGHSAPERNRTVFHAPRVGYALVEDVMNYGTNRRRETRSLQKSMKPVAYTIGKRVRQAVVAYPTIAAACCATHLPAHANAGKRRLVELELGPGVVRTAPDGALYAPEAMPRRLLPVPKAFWRETRPRAPTWTPTFGT